MPWHSSAMKDAISCEKLRLGAHGHMTRRSPNGKTLLDLSRNLYSEYIGVEKRTYRTETSHVGIGKDINRDSPSSGERTGNSLNQGVTPGVTGPRYGTDYSSLSGLEKPTIDGYSPVGERGSGLMGTLSRAGHVKPCLKSGGPPSKAKYERMTDSEAVP